MPGAVFIGWADVASGLLIVAVLAILPLAGVLAVLRNDRRSIEAAERLENVDLTALAQRHLPPALWTQTANQEIPLLKAAVRRKMRIYRRMIAGCGLMAVLTAPAAGFIHHRSPPEVRATDMAARRPAPVQVLKAVDGTWGWKHDAMLSCERNPMMIRLFDNGRKMSSRFREPVWIGSEQTNGYDYDVTGTRGNELLLHLSGAPAEDSFGRPLEWALVFADEDNFHLRRSDRTTDITSDMVRCRK